jgi:hypothetical protein
MKLNGITRSEFKLFSLNGLLLTASIAFLSACGGGVDVVYDGTNNNAPHATDAMAQRAAATAFTGGPVSLYAPAGLLLDNVSDLLTTLDANGINYYTTQTLDISGVCASKVGQLIIQTVDVGNDRRFTPGDTASLTFTNCLLAADGLAVTLNGSVTMTVQSSTRGADVLSTFYFSPQNLSATLNGVSAVYSGLVGIEYAFPGGNLNAAANIAYVSDRIALSFAGSRTDEVTQMRWPVVISGTTAAPVTTLYPSHTLTLFENGYADVITTSTLSPLVFQGGSTANVFTAGQVRHFYSVDYLQTTVTSTNQSRTDIDFNNDGVNDRVINTPIRTLINSWN